MLYRTTLGVVGMWQNRKEWGQADEKSRQGISMFK